MRARTPRETYAALQRLARVQGRTTQQLFELYVHERFLARLALSPVAERFVLKGGMLLAVLDVRRPTRDADLRFSDVVAAVAAFVDGVAAQGAERWSPAGGRWEPVPDPAQPAM